VQSYLQLGRPAFAKGTKEMIMIEGFKKTASRIALVAAAGLMFGAAMTPAKAADLGGGCCADLEERVAELEATTARKGNRVVSLQIYGQVNKALMIWDDGIDSDAYVVDNTLASSRFGFAGSAKISSTLSAGYNMEFELIDSRADMVYNDVGGDDMEGGLNLRQNFWYLEHATLGRISVGRQSTAADGATEVVLSNSMRNADPNIGANMWIRGKDGSFVSPLNTTVIETGGYPAHYLQWANDLTADRIASVIRYDSPSIAGFILSASAGADDYADVALRFKREFNSLRVAAAVTYIWDDQVEGLENNVFAGSISAMHTPTGLYAAFSAGNREFDDAIFNDQSFWYVQAGIERKWTSCGATTLYGEYGNYSDFLVNVDPISSEATRWGLGINQKIDAAAMDIYAHATFWSFDEDALAPAYGGGFEDLTTVVIGSRIQF
jgi:predicted porin